MKLTYLNQPFPVALVDVRVLSHATENPDKVLKAFKEVISVPTIEEIEIMREKLEGHYGNTIDLMHVKIRTQSLARKIVENIFSKLEEHDRLWLSANVEDRLDEEGSLYLRLDKQAAYNGQLKFADTDQIRVQIKLAIPRKQKEKIIETFREIIQ